MSAQPAKLIAELVKLNSSGVVELFILDASAQGGGILYFYNGVSDPLQPELASAPVKFQGRSYLPMPIEVKGFEFRSKGELPRPVVRFSNVFGLLTSLVLLYDDLVDAVLTRKRTLRKYLDDGTDPDPTCEFPPDVYFVDRKVSETKQAVEFELGSSLDVDGVSLPRRQVSSNLCSWGYRSPECGFAENRHVASFTGVYYPEELAITRYRGTWNLALNYSTGDAVSSPLSAVDESFYYALQASVNKPVSDGVYWRRAQHYRGKWTPKLYFRNDVVYVLGRNGDRQYFILTVSTANGPDSEPPNLNLWQPDQCAKSVVGCRLRNDPLKLNKTLPYGAFPGTSRSLLV